MRLVIVESPFAAPAAAKEYSLFLARDIENFHLQYARAAVRHCLLSGESPIASHLLYTQRGILQDDLPEERKLGIEAGLAWLELSAATIVFTDLGITSGMQKGIDRAQEILHPVEHRSLQMVCGADWIGSYNELLRPLRLVPRA